MADGEGVARKPDNGVAVSSGDSSAASPQPALGSEETVVSKIPKLDDGSDATLVVPALPASDPSDANTIVGASRADVSPSLANSVYKAIGATVFEEGAVLGGRYEILKLLGMGGMGAVYKARDTEVDRIVGLKVIRPDLAGNPAILARFKQELVLARQVTHKNIIRIYDLNEADGVKFITMEFVEGEDLRTILTRERKLAPPEAADIMLQSCAGLQAIHSEGVIHRDLKPSNIMRDGAGRVVIMDFGLAKTVQSDGMTQTGMMIGTMEYMSPEQAMGGDLDARSDIFAVGLIFYELLTGYIPFRADSAIASLVKRTQERAVPLVDVDSSLPPVLSEIVAKCLERKPDERYASAQALIDDLEAWQGKRSRASQVSFGTRTLPAIPVPAVAKQRQRKWLVLAVAVVLCAAVGSAIWYKVANHPGTSATQGPAMSLAVIPYYNASGDPSLNWMSSSVSETLSSDIGQSRHLHVISPGRLQQVLRDLHISPDSQLDLSTLRRIADFTNADNVVFGKYVKSGDQILITSTLFDVKQDHTVEIQTQIAGEKDLLGGLDKLAEDVRKKLAVTPEILSELEKSSQRVPTQSIPALQAYEEGNQLARSGDFNKALSKFEEATTADPNFALAFSRLAETYSRLGFDDKADIASRRALALADNLSAADRYRIQASHARIAGDTAKATEAYENLTKVNPGDFDAQFALANLYLDASRFDDARKRLKLVLDSDPKNLDALVAMGKLEIMAGNSQAALDVLNRGLSEAIQFDNAEARASILHSMGVAWEDLNKPQDALKNLQEALAIRRQINDQLGISKSLNEIGSVQDSLGNSAAALASYKEALTVRRQIGDKKGTAKTLIQLGSFYHDHGQYAEALPLMTEALQLFRDLGDEAGQAQALNNLGSIYFNQGNYQAALTYFQQAYDIRDKLHLAAGVAESLHNLAETNARLGQFDAATSENLKALETYKRAGDEKMAAVVSASMAALFDAQGQYARAASAGKEAADTFRKSNDRTANAVEAIGGYGNTLAEMGRGDDGQAVIEEALKIADDVKNDSIRSLALNWLGDSYFYRGNFSAAQQQYERALQGALKSGDHQRMVLSRFNLAKVDVWQGRAPAAIAPLQKVVDDADQLGLKALSVQASTYLADAMLAANKLDKASQELDKAINRSEKLGLLVEQARTKYLHAQLLVRTDKAKEAVPEYRESVRILESISKEDGAARFLERADLKDIYRDALKSYQGEM